MVTKMLSRGVNADTVGGYDGTALQAASARGHKKIVQPLLDKDADVNIEAESMTTLSTLPHQKATPR